MCFLWYVHHFILSLITEPEPEWERTLTHLWYFRSLQDHQMFKKLDIHRKAYSWKSVLFRTRNIVPFQGHYVLTKWRPLKSLLLKICPFQDKKHRSFSGTLCLNKVNTFEKLTPENLSLSGQETWISFFNQARAVNCEPSAFWVTSVMSFSLQGSLVIATCTPKKKGNIMPDTT